MCFPLQDEELELANFVTGEMATYYTMGNPAIPWLTFMAGGGRVAYLFNVPTSRRDGMAIPKRIYEDMLAEFGIRELAIYNREKYHSPDFLTHGHPWHPGKGHQDPRLLCSRRGPYVLEIEKGCARCPS